MAPRAYAFSREITNAGADRALLQIHAPAAIPLRILRFSCGNLASETSENNAIKISRKSAAATVTAAVIATDVRPLATGDAASTVQVGTANTGYNASTAGTDSDVLVREAFNWVGSGYLWLPTPAEYIYVPGGGIIAFSTLAAFTGTGETRVVFEELA